MERRREFRASRPCDAVRGPRSSLGMEGTVIGRMPIARGEDGGRRVDKQVQISLQSRNDGLSLRHREGSAGQKIVLNVYDDQCIAGSEAIHEGLGGISRIYRLMPLLNELADIGQRVLPLRFGQLLLPLMHRAEDNPVLDRSEQFFV